MNRFRARMAGWGLSSLSAQSRGNRQSLEFRRRRGRAYSSRLRNEIPKFLPKDRLEQLHLGEGLSTKHIARTRDLSQSCVYNLFKRYELQTRTLQEAMALQKKPATSYKRVRWRATEFLGGRCVHCGCDDLRVLEVHHKLSGGGLERRRGGDAFWYNMPSGRRGISDLVRCRPCHAAEEAKRLYGLGCFRAEWRGS